jgi:hypothetical protein
MIDQILTRYVQYIVVLGVAYDTLCSGYVLLLLRSTISNYIQVHV